MPVRALIVLGTRPEGVKLFPLYSVLREDSRFDVGLASTGQHRELLADVLEPLGVVPDMDLGLMRPGQTLNELVARAVGALDLLYREWRPDVVIVQGDTSSAFCAGLAAFQFAPRVRLAHVEAGLRTYNRLAPYPEEAYRHMLSLLADFHFAPTESAARQLERDGISREQVVVTGNTIVDALRLFAFDTGTRQSVDEPVRNFTRPTVFVSLHRREQWTPGVANDGRGSWGGALQAIRDVVMEYPSVSFVYRIHPNRALLEAVTAVLGGLPNVHLVEPIRSYPAFLALLRRMDLILTDSGGIQEEAPLLGVPVLIARDNTERPEVLVGGQCRLIGAGADAIRTALSSSIAELLDRGQVARLEPRGDSPLGDGHASERIRDALLYYMGRSTCRPDDLISTP